MTRPGLKWPLFLFLVFFFTGCDQISRGPMEEEKDPHYLAGQKKYNAMDWDGAIESFEKALQSNPNNSAAHLALGTLYYDRKNDFAAAIYHFERHLRLRPNSPMAEVVNGQITACKRELAKTVSFALVGREVQQQLDRYIHTNNMLRQRIEALEIELNRRPRYITNYVTNFVAIPEFSPNERSAARMTRPAEPVAASQPQQQQAAPSVRQPDPTPPARQSASSPPAARTTRNTTPPARAAAPSQQQRASRSHKVRPGETLEVIARKYGVSVSALKRANPSASRGSRAGQTLVIPSR